MGNYSLYKQRLTDEKLYRKGFQVPPKTASSVYILIGEKMKLDKKTQAQVEHYAYAVVVAGVAIYQTGNHDIKKVAWAALVGVLGPVFKAGIDKLKTTINK
jgi:hypothetical protein